MLHLTIEMTNLVDITDIISIGNIMYTSYSMWLNYFDNLIVSYGRSNSNNYKTKINKD